MTIKPIRPIQPVTPVRPWQPVNVIKPLVNVQNINRYGSNVTSDPYDLNSMTDVLFNTEARKKAYNDITGLNLGNNPLDYLSGTVVSAVKYINEGFIQPFFDNTETAWVDVVSNGLQAVSEDMDVLSNITKGMIIETGSEESALFFGALASIAAVALTIGTGGVGTVMAAGVISGGVAAVGSATLMDPEGAARGFARAAGYTSEGKYNYKFDTGNWLADYYGEIVVDPLNWLSAGSLMLRGASRAANLGAEGLDGASRAVGKMVGASANTTNLITNIGKIDKMVTMAALMSNPVGAALGGAYMLGKSWGSVRLNSLTSLLVEAMDETAETTLRTNTTLMEASYDALADAPSKVRAEFFIETNVFQGTEAARFKATQGIIREVVERTGIKTGTVAEMVKSIIKDMTYAEPGSFDWAAKYINTNLLDEETLHNIVRHWTSVSGEAVGAAHVYKLNNWVAGIDKVDKYFDELVGRVNVIETAREAFGIKFAAMNDQIVELMGGATRVTRTDALINIYKVLRESHVDFDTVDVAGSANTTYMKLIESTFLTPYGLTMDEFLSYHDAFKKGMALTDTSYIGDAPGVLGDIKNMDNIIEPTVNVEKTIMGVDTPKNYSKELEGFSGTTVLDPEQQSLIRSLDAEPDDLNPIVDDTFQTSWAKKTRLVIDESGEVVNKSRSESGSNYIALVRMLPELLNVSDNLMELFNVTYNAPESTEFREFFEHFKDAPTQDIKDELKETYPTMEEETASKLALFLSDYNMVLKSVQDPTFRAAIQYSARTRDADFAEEKRIEKQRIKDEAFANRGKAVSETVIPVKKSKAPRIEDQYLGAYLRLNATDYDEIKTWFKNTKDDTLRILMSTFETYNLARPTVLFSEQLKVSLNSANAVQGNINKIMQFVIMTQNALTPEIAEFGQAILNQDDPVGKFAMLLANSSIDVFPYTGVSLDAQKVVSDFSGEVDNAILLEDLERASHPVKVVTPNTRVIMGMKQPAIIKGEDEYGMTFKMFGKQMGFWRAGDLYKHALYQEAIGKGNKALPIVDLGKLRILEAAQVQHLVDAAKEIFEKTHVTALNAQQDAVTRIKTLVEEFTELHETAVKQVQKVQSEIIRDYDLSDLLKANEYLSRLEQSLEGAVIKHEESIAELSKRLDSAELMDVKLDMELHTAREEIKKDLIKKLDDVVKRVMEESSKLIKEREVNKLAGLFSGPSIFTKDTFNVKETKIAQLQAIHKEFLEDEKLLNRDGVQHVLKESFQPTTLKPVNGMRSYVEKTAHEGFRISKTAAFVEGQELLKKDNAAKRRQEIVKDGKLPMSRIPNVEFVKGGQPIAAGVYDVHITWPSIASLMTFRKFDLGILKSENTYVMGKAYLNMYGMYRRQGMNDNEATKSAMYELVKGVVRIDAKKGLFNNYREMLEIGTPAHIYVFKYYEQKLKRLSPKIQASFSQDYAKFFGILSAKFEARMKLRAMGKITDVVRYSEEDVEILDMGVAAMTEYFLTPIGKDVKKALAMSLDPEEINMMHMAQHAYFDAIAKSPDLYKYYTYDMETLRLMSGKDQWDFDMYDRPIIRMMSLFFEGKYPDMSKAVTFVWDEAVVDKFVMLNKQFDAQDVKDLLYRLVGAPGVRSKMLFEASQQEGMSGSTRHKFKGIADPDKPNQEPSDVIMTAPGINSKYIYDTVVIKNMEMLKNPNKRMGRIRYVTEQLLSLNKNPKSSFSGVNFYHDTPKGSVSRMTPDEFSAQLAKDRIDIKGKTWIEAGVWRDGEVKFTTEVYDVPAVEVDQAIVDHGFGFTRGEPVTPFLPVNAKRYVRNLADMRKLMEETFGTKSAMNKMGHDRNLFYKSNYDLATEVDTLLKTYFKHYQSVPFGKVVLSDVEAAKYEPIKGIPLKLVDDTDKMELVGRPKDLSAGAQVIYDELVARREKALIRYQDYLAFEQEKALQSQKTIQTGDRVLVKDYAAGSVINPLESNAFRNEYSKRFRRLNDLIALRDGYFNDMENHVNAKGKPDGAEYIDRITNPISGRSSVTSEGKSSKYNIAEPMESYAERVKNLADMAPELHDAYAEQTRLGVEAAKQLDAYVVKGMLDANFDVVPEKHQPQDLERFTNVVDSLKAQKEVGQYTRDALFEAHLHFVYRLSAKYTGMGLARWDVIQAGNEALRKAVNNYELTTHGGASLETYAYPAVTFAMLHAVQETGRTIEVPHNIAEAMSKWQVMRNNYGLSDNFYTAKKELEEMIEKESSNQITYEEYVKEQLREINTERTVFVRLDHAHTDSYTFWTKGMSLSAKSRAVALDPATGDDVEVGAIFELKPEEMQTFVPQGRFVEVLSKEDVPGTLGMYKITFKYKEYIPEEGFIDKRDYNIVRDPKYIRSGAYDTYMKRRGTFKKELADLETIATLASIQQALRKGDKTFEAVRAEVISALDKSFPSEMLDMIEEGPKGQLAFKFDVDTPVVVTEEGLSVPKVANINFLKASKTIALKPGQVYVGRNIIADRQSPLGNPHVMSRTDPDQNKERLRVIGEFSKDLEHAIKTKTGPMYEEFMSLVMRVQKGEVLELLCHCAPKRCHAEIISSRIFRYLFEHGEVFEDVSEELDDTVDETFFDHPVDRVSQEVLNLIDPNTIAQFSYDDGARFYFLSNTSNAEMKVLDEDGVTRVYHNLEAAYQARKFVLAADKERINNVKNTKGYYSGSGAKTEAYKILGEILGLNDKGQINFADLAKHPDRLHANFHSKRLDTMAELLEIKFGQNPVLKSKLLGTNDRPLMEGNNWKDDFFGVYTPAGLNMLGSMLMRLRGTYGGTGFVDWRKKMIKAKSYKYVDNNYHTHRGDLPESLMSMDAVSVIGSRDMVEGKFGTKFADKRGSVIWERFKALEKLLADLKVVVRSGGAPGSDDTVSRFSPVGYREIYVPHKGFTRGGKWDEESKTFINTLREYPVPDEIPLNDLPNAEMAYAIAYRHYAKGEDLDSRTGAVKALMARNTYQVLGRDLISPSKFIISWTPGGNVDGSDPSGTSQAQRIGVAHGIPIFNIENDSDYEALTVYLSKQIRDKAMGITPKYKVAEYGKAGPLRVKPLQRYETQFEYAERAKAELEKIKYGANDLSEIELQDIEESVAKLDPTLGKWFKNLAALPQGVVETGGKRALDLEYTRNEHDGSKRKLEFLANPYVPESVVEKNPRILDTMRKIKENEEHQKELNKAYAKEQDVYADALDAWNGAKNVVIKRIRDMEKTKGELLAAAHQIMQEEMAARDKANVAYQELRKYRNWLMKAMSPEFLDKLESEYVNQFFGEPDETLKHYLELLKDQKISPEEFILAGTELGIGGIKGSYNAIAYDNGEIWGSKRRTDSVTKAVDEYPVQGGKFVQPIVMSSPAITKALKNRAIDIVTALNQDPRAALASIEDHDAFFNLFRLVTTLPEYDPMIEDMMVAIRNFINRRIRMLPYGARTVQHVDHFTIDASKKLMKFSIPNLIRQFNLPETQAAMILEKNQAFWEKNFEAREDEEGNTIPPVTSYFNEGERLIKRLQQEASTQYVKLYPDHEPGGVDVQTMEDLIYLNSTSSTLGGLHYYSPSAGTYRFFKSYIDQSDKSILDDYPTIKAAWDTMTDGQKIKFIETHDMAPKFEDMARNALLRVWQAETERRFRTVKIGAVEESTNNADRAMAIATHDYAHLGELNQARHQIEVQKLAESLGPDNPQLGIALHERVMSNERLLRQLKQLEIDAKLEPKSVGTFDTPEGIAEWSARTISTFERLLVAENNNIEAFTQMFRLESVNNHMFIDPTLNPNFDPRTLARLATEYGIHYTTFTNPLNGKVVNAFVGDINNPAYMNIKPLQGVLSKAPGNIASIGARYRTNMDQLFVEMQHAATAPFAFHWEDALMLKINGDDFVSFLLAYGIVEEEEAAALFVADLQNSGRILIPMVANPDLLRSFMTNMPGSASKFIVSTAYTLHSGVMGKDYFMRMLFDRENQISSILQTTNPAEAFKLFKAMEKPQGLVIVALMPDHTLERFKIHNVKMMQIAMEKKLIILDYITYKRVHKALNANRLNPFLDWVDRNINSWFKAGIMSNPFMGVRNYISNKERMLGVGDPRIFAYLPIAANALKVYQEVTHEMRKFKTFKQQMEYLNSQSPETVKIVMKMQQAVAAWMSGAPLEDVVDISKAAVAAKKIMRERTDKSSVVQHLVWGNPLTKTMVDFQGWAEDRDRLATFLYFLDSGMGATGAAMRVGNMLVDYGIKTKGEEILNVAVPFSMWRLHNAIYWMEEGMDHPWVLRALLDLVDQSWQEEKRKANAKLTGYQQQMYNSGNINLGSVIMKMNPTFLDALTGIPGLLANPLGPITPTVSNPIKVLSGDMSGIQFPWEGIAKQVTTTLQGVQQLRDTGSAPLNKLVPGLFAGNYTNSWTSYQKQPKWGGNISSYAQKMASRNANRVTQSSMWYRKNFYNSIWSMKLKPRTANPTFKSTMKSFKYR